MYCCHFTSPRPCCIEIVSSSNTLAIMLHVVAALQQVLPSLQAIHNGYFEGNCKPKFNSRSSIYCCYAFILQFVPCVTACEGDRPKNDPTHPAVCGCNAKIYMIQVDSLSKIKTHQNAQLRTVSQQQQHTSNLFERKPIFVDNSWTKGDVRKQLVRLSECTVNMCVCRDVKYVKLRTFHVF